MSLLKAENFFSAFLREFRDSARLKTHSRLHKKFIRKMKKFLRFKRFYCVIKKLKLGHRVTLWQIRSYRKVVIAADSGNLRLASC